MPRPGGSTSRRVVLVAIAAAVCITWWAVGGGTDPAMDAIAVEARVPPTARPKRRRPLLPSTAHNETDPQLRFWNAEYHRRRLVLREEQRAAGTGALPRHFFWTMDCTLHSLWQSMALEASWERHEDPTRGFISRVVSGCTGMKKKQPLMHRHAMQHPDIDRHRGSFFSPSVTHLPNGKHYAPYNRPTSLLYWLNHTDLTEEVFILLDPDMVFLRPLRGASLVRPGRPVAQYYHYMDTPRHASYNCRLCPRPGYDHKPYAVGPPWLLDRSDLLEVLPLWVALVPEVDRISNGAWIAEMVAYAVACAAKGKPHTVIHDAMVELPGTPHVWNSANNSLYGGKLPPALSHYCYTFEVGEQAPRGAEAGWKQHHRMVARERDQKHPVLDYYHFSKYRVPTDWPGGAHTAPRTLLDCGMPIFQNFEVPHPFLPRQWHRWQELTRVTIAGLNAMLRQYKARYCNDAADPPNVQERLRTSHMAHMVMDYVVDSIGSNGTVVFHHHEKPLDKKTFQLRRVE